MANICCCFKIVQYVASYYMCNFSSIKLLINLLIHFWMHGMHGMDILYLPIMKLNTNLVVENVKKLGDNSQVMNLSRIQM